MIKIPLFLILVVGNFRMVTASTIFFEPQLYFSELDSPFFGGIIDNAGDGIFLENFEDGLLNTQNVLEPPLPVIGSTIRSRLMDVPDGRVVNVDGDDGAVDGMTFAGDSWSTINRSSMSSADRIEFQFTPDANGNLPRYVGIVITRVFDVDADVEVSWRDQEGRTLFNDGEFDPKSWSPLGGTGNGDPRLHRFIGLFHSEGIERIQLDNVDQVDHLQYGFSIPEPTVSLFTIFSSTLLLIFRKRV